MVIKNQKNSHLTTTHQKNTQTQIQQETDQSVQTNIHKEKMVQNIFSSIAKRYDLANRVLTFGLDASWRKKLIQLSEIKADAQVLDCATGTGALAITFLKYLNANGKVTAVDFCDQMLNQVPNKYKHHPQIEWIKANIMNLPFDNNQFDVTSIAYGLRNVSDTKKALKEMARVTKKGGTLMVLETGMSAHPFITPFLSAYYKNIVPWVGGWLTGNKKAYQYLNESSHQFASKKQMVQIFESTQQFQNISYISLLGGASFIYKAIVC